jgi:hypothetical protein
MPGVFGNLWPWIADAVIWPPSRSQRIPVSPAMVSKRHKELMEILLQDYEAATKHYAWAVAEMQRFDASSSEEQFRLSCRIAEKAYHDCERLRKAASEIGTNNKIFALTNLQRREAVKSSKTEREAEIPRKLGRAREEVPDNFAAG